MASSVVRVFWRFLEPAEGVLGHAAARASEVGEKAPPLLECTMAMDFVAQGTPEISALKGEKLWEFPPYNRADGWKRVRNLE